MSADDPAATKARDVLEMLRRHYLPEGRQPAGIFAPEIEAPGGRRRADLIWQGVTTASGSQLVGHEIKVSRTDVLVELQDLTKTDPWQQYCDRWWLVVPDPALIAGLTLPASWGVLGPPSGRRTRSMTVLVDAPKLKPVDKAAAYATIAKWLHWRHHNQRLELMRANDETRRLLEQNRQLHDRVPAEPRGRGHLDRIVERVVVALGGTDGPDHVGNWQHRVPVEDVVAALRDLGSVYYTADALQYRVREVERALTAITAGIDACALQDFHAAAAKLRTPIEAAS